MFLHIHRMLLIPVNNIISHMSSLENATFLKKGGLIQNNQTEYAIHTTLKKIRMLSYSE